MTFRRYLWSVIVIGVMCWPVGAAAAFILRQPGDSWATWVLLGGATSLLFAGLFSWLDRAEVFKDWPE